MPVTLGLVTAGAGLVQSVFGGIGAKKARRQLENLATPSYAPAKSITDYYSQALNRYQESPYQSNLYKMQAQNIARGTAQGISALQDRRSGQAGISALIQGQNDALLKAGVAAEQQKNQRFGQLGAASQAMAAEKRKEFEVNQMLPYQTKANLLAQKAAGNTQIMNAGLQNIYGGLTGSLMGKLATPRKGISTSSNVSNPTYYNGYSAGDFSNSGFETEF